MMDPKQEIMFLDFKSAIDRSAFIQPGLEFEYLSRPKRRSSRQPLGHAEHYKFDIDALKESFKNCGHTGLKLLDKPYPHLA